MDLPDFHGIWVSQEKARFGVVQVFLQNVVLAWGRKHAFSCKIQSILFFSWQKYICGWVWGREEGLCQALLPFKGKFAGLPSPSCNLAPSCVSGKDSSMGDLLPGYLTSRLLACIWHWAQACGCGWASLLKKINSANYIQLILLELSVSPFSWLMRYGLELLHLSGSCARKRQSSGGAFALWLFRLWDHGRLME